MWSSCWCCVYAWHQTGPISTKSTKWQCGKGQSFVLELIFIIVRRHQPSVSPDATNDPLLLNTLHIGRQHRFLPAVIQFVPCDHPCLATVPRQNLLRRHLHQFSIDRLAGVIDSWCLTVCLFACLIDLYLWNSVSKLSKRINDYNWVIIESQLIRK